MSTATAERSWCVVVPHHARGARQARHRLAAELGNVVAASLLADVIAVLAELVGNAIRHAEPLPGGVVRVAWRLRVDDAGAEAVTVRVTDGGASNRSPALRPVGTEAVDGRGLRIVVALAEQWGIERDGLGQSVWAALSGQHPAQQAAQHQARQPAQHQAKQPAQHQAKQPAQPPAESSGRLAAQPAQPSLD
ncbi:MAG: ATP-binding protein [Micromonosporaceae bacterium]|nr:ATP-binding protein [Micromonosporaceae bacterium]